MKRTILAVAAVLMVLSSMAQISERLQNEIDQNLNKLQWVSIEFPRFMDDVALRAFFSKNNTPASERLKMVNRLLMAEAKTAQKEALAILYDSPGEAVFSQSFYAVNRIMAQVDGTTISALAHLPNVQSIDLATGKMEFFKPVSIGNPNPQKTSSLTGPEPGIVAINSPAMWNLGYTGRGRKVFIYDTGVWPTHPAISNRYLGNFRPTNEAWYGYFIDEPNGHLADHGTHVLGTVGGLDTATADTIGSAFGAYWMACDLINSGNAADLPPQVELIAAFEWALNPDGDTNTTDDVPDVINNSWRWYDPTDTNECNGFIPQLMSTIELAGIAKVFSGGNTGPNNVGVASPQRINTTEINTFTVGAVNANASYPYPIASFSTRGPTQCGGTGSLQLFPEVVAPGQNVRSSVGTDDYDFYSGTSMASPHVSGALLLLKEAFPTLSGDQLISALYNTAIDFGPPGEDNTFGKGLIDVHAAYQLLAQTHTPVNPNTVPWDVAIKHVNYPSDNDVICDAQFQPTIIAENLGASTIDSLWLRVFDNGTPTNPQPALILTPGFTAGTTYTLPTNLQYPIHAGNHVWHFSVDINKPEYDLVNNQRYVRFKKLETGILPFLEDFENGLDSSKWHVTNADYATTWDTTHVLGWTGNKHAAFVNLAQYVPAQNQRDGLLTKRLTLPTAIPISGQIGLGFHVAYQYRGIGVLSDTLSVFISEDCGVSFTKVYEKYGQMLATTSSSGKFFVPQNDSEWRRELINLNSFVGKEVVIKFETTNRHGNTIYVDNISVYVGSVDPFSVDELQRSAFHLYPNPAHEVLTIELANVDLIGIVKIVDTRGTLVGRFEIDDLKTKIDVSDLAAGVYIITVGKADLMRRTRFVKF